MENKFKIKNFIMVAVVYLCYEVGSYYYQGYLAEQELLNEPFFQVIKKHRPSEYQELLSIAEDVKRGNSSSELLENQLGFIMTKPLSEFPYYASNEDIYKYYKTLINISNKLEPEPCYKFFYTGVEKKSKYLNEELKIEFMDTMRTLIESFYTSKQRSAIISKEKFGEGAKNYIVEILKENPTLDLTVLGKENLNYEDKKHMCFFSKSVMSAFLDDKQIELLRYNLANSR